jgi:flagellum-specific peptidoglycan hydrolase FlgJ
MKQNYFSQRMVVGISIYLIIVYLILWTFSHKQKSANDKRVGWESSTEMSPDIPEIADELEKKDTAPIKIPETFNPEKKLFLLKFEKIPNDLTQRFVDRFLKTAIVEKWKYNIPISITLAQGIVESACGTSNLSIKANNFFGMKCGRRCNSCDGRKWQVVGNCINATDDSKHDLFQMFKSPWYSWRAHSILLTIPRYNHLRKLDPLEYKKWARGLKRAGYATEPKYAQILINYIERYKLNQYDQVDIHKLAKDRGVDLTKIPKHK